MPIDSTRRTTLERTTRDMAAALALLGVGSLLVPGPLGELAGLQLGPAALAQVAGSASGLSSTIQPATIVDAAKTLASQGKIVEAKSLLETLAASNSMTGLSGEQRTEALELLNSIRASERSADPLEVSLQKAELGVKQGDLLLAERQANLVAGTSMSSDAQRSRASAVLDAVQTGRAEIGPRADSILAQAQSAVQAGRFAEAKSGVMTLVRSGAVLGTPQADQLEQVRMQIVQHEQSRGMIEDPQALSQADGQVLAGREPGDVRQPTPAVPELPAVPPASEMPASATPAAEIPAVMPAAPASAPVPAAYPNAVIPVPGSADVPANTGDAASITITTIDASADGTMSAPMVDSTGTASSSTGGSWGRSGGQGPDHNFEPWTFPNRRRTPATQPESAPATDQGTPTWQPATESSPAAQDMPPSVTMSPPTQGDDLITLAMKAEALRLLAEADQAFDQARYSLAAEKYQTALTQYRRFLSQPEAERAEKRLAESNIRLGGNVAGDRLGQSIVDGLTLRQQQARAQYENELQQARQRLSEGDTARAADLAARARLTITGAKNAFSEPEFDGYIRQLEQFNVEIEARRDQLAKDDATKREADLKEKAKLAEGNRILDRDRKVSEAIDRVRALQQERKYTEALQVVDQALFLDPNNPTALLLRDLIRDISMYERFRRAQEEKQYNHALQSQDNELSTIPPRDFVEYPTDWPAKTFLRGEMGLFTDAPENRRVLASLSDKKIDLNFSDNRFEDVIGFLSKVTGQTIDADWDSLATVGIDKDTLLTLRAPAVRADSALNRIVAKLSRDATSKPGWAVNEGIISVASDEQLRKNRVLHIYNILDLLLEPTRINEQDSPQIDLQGVLQQGQGGSGSSPFTGAGQQGQQQSREQQEQRRIQRVRQITDIIQQNVDFEGWRDNGGETGYMQELSGSLIIRNTPQNHREIVGLLSKLREIRNMQINVETKFLLVNQSWFEQIGFNIDVVFNTNSNTVEQAAAVNPNVRPSDFFEFNPQNLQAGSRPGLRRIATDVPFRTPVPVGTPPATANSSVIGGAPTSWSPIGVGSGSLGLSQALSEGDFAGQVLRSAPALGIAGQFLDDIQVDFLIQATQADKRTVQLTAPRLTFTNGQTSNIYVVTQQAFVSDLQPVTAESAVGFDPTIGVISEGVTMLVEGVVSADRRYVTMNIDAGVARIDGFAQQAVTAVTGGQLVNSRETQSFLQLPTLTVTRVRTTATVPDEGTLLIGGQRLITEVEVETGVPVLSKIPILNRFFTNRLESKEEQTLLVLLKPTILIQSEEEEKAFPGLLDSVRTGGPIGGSGGMTGR
jgi:type II secretory pathway component GspD/PulD (secretin)